MIGRQLRQQPLWPSLLLPPLLIVVVGLLLAALHREIGDAERTHRRWQDRIRSPHTAPRTPTPTISDGTQDKALTTYRQLVRRSLRQPDARLDWTDTLAKISQRWQLGETTVDIGPPIPLPIETSPHDQPTGGYRLTVSAMHLETHARHENDLLGALTDLERSIAAHPIVRACRLRRNELPPNTGSPAYVFADCTIDLIALDKLP